METDSKPAALKDYFNAQAAAALGAQMERAWPGFDARRFRSLATQGLSLLEFHGRVAHFSHALHQTLPSEVPAALQVLVRSLPPALPNCERVTDGWLQWPVGHFIAEHGVEHFDESMAAMVELTQRFSAEFAVRPFVERFPARTLGRLLDLTGHESPHVRRWCSEGTRPRLPWGKRLDALVADPSSVLPILERLKDDPEPYVRKSVANCLNDIGKDHPEVLVQTGRRWLKGAGPGRQWVVKHALRTLVKAGRPEALALLGYGDARGTLSGTLSVSPKRIQVGQAVELVATVRSEGSGTCRVLVDYVVHFVRKREGTGAKVFKWTEVEVAERGAAQLRKRHPFRRTTVRALYPGVHRIELQVNGRCLAEASLELL